MKDKEKKIESENMEGSPKDASQADAAQSKAENFEAKYNEVNEKYTRLYAEFDNFRKRTAREKVDWIKSAGEEMILKILPVLDDIERAMVHEKNINDPETLKKGLEIIQNKFKNILSGKGVEAMEAKGQPFNPDLHDAITSIAAATEDLKGKVIEEVEKGYLMNGKVIRHAKVVVGN